MTTAAYADQKISLNDTNSSLNEVVVTAMGIKRDRKALEYATKAVKPFLLLFFFYINNLMQIMSIGLVAYFKSRDTSQNHQSDDSGYREVIGQCGD